MNANSLQSHKGAALITSLVLLMALTMVALSAVQTTSVQVLISGNGENTLAARQYAQSAVDDIIQNNNANNFAIGAKTGYTVCVVQNAANSCDKTNLTFTDPMFATIGASATNGIQAEVTFLKNGAAPRLSVNQASSASAFHGAFVAVTGNYDVQHETAGRPDGTASVTQGFVMILPQSQ